MDAIFTPLKIKNLEIKNRVVLPPMVCFSFAGTDGFVSEKNINHYENMAKGGTGLVIVEATCVNIDGRLSPDQLGIWSDKFIDGLRKISEVCHKHGAKAFLQLHHGGLRTHKAVSENTITSSDYNDGKVTSRAMSIDELRALKQDFINAASRAEKAGFDGIELHGAHSYLMTQFFSEKVNNRTDEYGGNFENRLRFATEIIEGIKLKVNENFVVGIRMGCNENSLDNSIAMAKKLEAIGIDYLHVSTGFDNTKIDVEMPESFPGNWIVYGAAKIKENVTIPVIAVNSIKAPEEIRFYIDNNLVDFVAVGRGQLADYNFVNHIKEGQPIVECLSCRPCKWFSNGDNCPRHI
jgi:2,4-dienoyl-CoA reductase-like NADH-dependent reductase (Old Yellow Enzyme family)